MLLSLNVEIYNEYSSQIKGIPESIINYILTNDILINREFRYLEIYKVSCLTDLSDLRESIVDCSIHKNGGIYKIEIDSEKDKQCKYGTLEKTIEWLKNLRIIFLNENIKEVTIKRERGNYEIL